MIMRDQTVITTDVPARLERLPFSRFHWLVIFALGITWILDGLEVTIVGSLTGALQERSGLAFSNEQIGLAGKAYLRGAGLGALLFWGLTYRLCPQERFPVNGGGYIVPTAATEVSW